MLQTLNKVQTSPGLRVQINPKVPEPLKPNKQPSSLITVALSGDPVLTLVTEKPAPALLTVALPGLLAGPMEAARVANALVAVAPLESHSAPVVVQLRGSTPISPLVLLCCCFSNQRRLTCTRQVSRRSRAPRRIPADRSLRSKRK